MKKDIEPYKNTKAPLNVVHWHDKHSQATGWIVIDSLINGIAGGGLFMHPQAHLNEVMDLAKSMTYKNRVIDQPVMGGAKGGIKFDHKDPEAKEVLKRFLIDNQTLIQHQWCTGGDLNTSSEDIESILKSETGFPTAFMCLSKTIGEVYSIPDQFENMSKRLSEPFNAWFTIGNCATGYSVAQVIQSVTYKIPRVLIQGFGKVGMSLAFFLHSLGLGQVVGICEKDGYIYNEEGIDVLALIKAKQAVNDKNPLFPLKGLLTEEQCRHYNWTPALDHPSHTLRGLFRDMPADLLCPCAERYSIDKETLRAFINPNEKQYIISGANNPFTSFEVIKDCLAKNIMLIPDWVSNAGNAILFVELLKRTAWHPHAVHDMLNKIHQHIKHFLDGAMEVHLKSQLSLYESCYQVAMQGKTLRQASPSIEA